MRFLQRQTPRLDQRHQFRHVLAQELAAAVDAFAKPVDDGLDPAADALACFQDEDIDAGGPQGVRRRQAGETGADDDDAGPFGAAVPAQPAQ